MDLNGNGYPDLFICCHRNDLGHIVNSKLIMNGPDGLDLDNAQDILGYGPHCFTSTHQGNALNRSDCEHYTSPVFPCAKPVSLAWQGETPFKTSISFALRFGNTPEDVTEARWSESISEKVNAVSAPGGTKYMQYQVTFRASGLVNSPRMTSVEIECE